MSDNGSSELQSPAGTDAQAMPLGMMMEFQQSLDMLSAVSPMSSPRSQNSLVPESTFLDERRDSGANIQETAKAGRKASMQNEVLNSIPPHLRGGFEAAGALVDWLDMRLLTYHEGFHMFEPDVHDQFSRLNFLTKAPSLVEDVPLSLLGELYEFLDANGDGVVSYDEWCTALDTVIHFRNVQSSGDGGIFAEVCPPLAGESLWIFDEFSPLRKRLAALLWNKWANITVVFSLLFIGCFRFVRHILGSEATTVTDSFEIFFGGLFTLEMLLRIVTLGFCLGRGSYLRSGWYKLDFVVVISFWLHMGLQLVDIQIPHLLSLRCLRLLLVLERIWIFDGIRVIMLALGEATGMLLYVTQAVWFVVLVFAILGTSAFGGTLQRQCLSSRGMPMQPPYSCKIFEDDRPPGFEDDPQSHNCPTGLFCVEGENPSYNQLSFDNLPQSLLALAQVLTLDDWAHQIMHPLRQGEPAWQAVMWIYFALLISLVSFVLLNLIVAVIITTFERWRRESQVSIFGQETRDTDMAVLQSQGRAKQHLFRHPSLYTSMARAKYKTLATAVMISPASALEALRQITNPMNVPSIPENNATSVFRKLSMTAGRVLHKGPSSDEQTDEDNLTRQARSSSVWLPRTQRGSVVHTGVRSQSVSGVASLSLKSDAPKTFQLPDATTIDIPPLPTGDVRDVGAAARQGSVRTTATVTTERSSEDPGSDVPAASGERPTVAASDYNSGLTRPDSFTLAHTITDSTGSTVAATLFDVLNSNKGDFEWPPGKATTDKDVRAAGEAALAGAEGKEGKESKTPELPHDEADVLAADATPATPGDNLICCHCRKAITDGEYHIFNKDAPVHVHSACRRAFVAQEFGVCAQCGNPVCAEPGRFGGSYSLFDDGSKVHSECREEFLSHKVERCCVCKDLLMAVEGRFSGAYTEFGNHDKVHAECRLVYVQRLPKCAHCHEPVAKMEGKFCGNFFQLPDGKSRVHRECMPEYRRAQAPKCAHCSDPILRDGGGKTGKFYDAGQGAKVHLECWAAHSAAR
mmetsp:Transcript_4448/g.10468  ORF Transcript_4448/g.10468 Transcript_4448/m.10468 type:complete len:1029 (-) Transcript_4448:8-3094(-)